MNLLHRSAQIHSFSEAFPESSSTSLSRISTRKASVLCVCYSKQKWKQKEWAKPLPKAKLLWLSCRKANFVVRAAEENGNAEENEKKKNTNARKALHALQNAADSFYMNFENVLKRETGIDLAPLRLVIIDALDKFRFEIWPRFAAWNSLEHWKKFNSWELRRWGVLLLYLIATATLFQRVYLGFHRRFAVQKNINKIAESYMEAVIPDPTPSNVRRLKKALWRTYMPEGLKVKKYILGPDGSYHHCDSYVGETAWEDDDPKQLTSETEKVVGTDLKRVEAESRNSNDALSLRGDVAEQQMTPRGTWQERLTKWKQILDKEKWEEDVNALTSKYVVVFDWKEMKENYLKDQERKKYDAKRRRGEWISKRWWQYRPKLPYTYFLEKIESLEVEAAVFTEDLRKVYVTMKEGFPSEYIVDMPVDPYIFELLERCGVETDTFTRSVLYYLLRGCAVLAPALIFMWYLGHITNVIKMTNSLYFPKFLTRREPKPEKLKTARDRELAGYGNTVFGGDVWVLLEEIMTFMKNAEKLHEKGATIPRGVLISGPPGTGKTHLVLTIAKESGYPVFFVSGADLSDPFYGVDWVGELFCAARKWGPAFIFIDEIDALAGKNISDDPMRKFAFDQLLNELDNNVMTRVVDTQQYSSHGVMVFYATNRPEELDRRFMQSGYVDREVSIGFPGEKERISIFSVHAKRKPLAKDVDFSKVAFRTSGFTGADIRGLVNEASILAARKGKREVSQQDIVDALDKELFESCGILLTEQEQRNFEENVPIENRKLLAVHESGHILLAHLFPRFDYHAFTFMFPGAEEDVLSLYYPREEMLQKGYPTVGYLKMQMIVAHGGRCAEKIIFNDISDQGYDDLANISRTARELVISPGNPRLGLLRMTWTGKYKPPFQISYDDPEAGLNKNEWREADRKAHMSVELSELFTREVTRYIKETEEAALEALQNNRHILDRLIEELLHRSKISGEDVDNIVKSMNPVMLPDLLHVPALNLDSQEVVIPPNFRGRYKELNIYPAPLHRC